MDSQKTGIAIIFIGAGLFFLFNSNNVAKGAAWLYKKIYTEKNLRVIFKIIGGLLILGGIIMLFKD